MRVVKVLNNSLVLALDDNGEETVIMSKGIGFSKVIGDIINPNDYEKTFVLKDKELSNNIITLAASIDAVYFEIAKSLIDYAKENYHMELSDYLLLALTDHLSFAAKRISEEIDIPNFYTMDLQQFNPDEYNLGLIARKQVQEHTGIELPMSEVSNIAFHFINAQKNKDEKMTNIIINNTVKDILEIVQYNFGIVYDEQSISYSRFVTHLTLFVQRIVQHKMLSSNRKDILFDQVSEQCHAEYECAQKIVVYVKERFQRDVSQQEQLYLTIHIHRILQEHQH